MSKKPFVPPLPHLDPPSQEAIDTLAGMTKKERRKLQKSAAYKDAIQRATSRRKAQKKLARKDWWKNNWIALLSLIFAFIAAIPVIVQGIAAILKLLE